jgi:hypothetical protein
MKKTGSQKSHVRLPLNFAMRTLITMEQQSRPRLFLLPWTLAPLRLMSHRDKTYYRGNGVVIFAVLAHGNAPVRQSVQRQHINRGLLKYFCSIMLTVCTPFVL